jgi:hypothetical protein
MGPFYNLCFSIAKECRIAVCIVEGDPPTLDVTGVAWDFVKVHSKSGSLDEEAKGAVESSAPFPMIWAACAGLVLAVSMRFVVAW